MYLFYKLHHSAFHRKLWIYLSKLQFWLFESSFRMGYSIFTFVWVFVCRQRILQLMIYVYVFVSASIRGNSKEGGVNVFPLFYFYTCVQSSDIKFAYFTFKKKITRPVTNRKSSLQRNEEGKKPFFSTTNTIQHFEVYFFLDIFIYLFFFHFVHQ